MSRAGPARVGRFEIERRIGRGAQGSVYLARDPILERRVAIKLLHPEHAALDPSGSEPVPREARLLSRLRHPNIVAIHDVGRHRGLPYLVFEYVHGRTLRELLRVRGALPLDEVCALAGPILDGVAHAHAEHVVHLDLNPCNIIVDPQGVPRIMDFGLARLALGAQPTTQPVGSLRYVAPEHFTDQGLGPHTDCLSLSLTFFELAAEASRHR